MRGKIYQFDDYLLDVSEQRLQKNGEAISLPPKVFEVLCVLVERHGQLVTYQELMETVWQDTFVEETNLRYSIHTLRKTFATDCIETVPKRGYRFVCEVESFTPEEFISRNTTPKTPAENSETAFSPARGKTFSRYFSKPGLLFSIAILMAGFGLLGFYLWSKQNAAGPQNPASLESLTVLPFRQIDEKSESGAGLQKGLADALIFNLSKIKGLKVTPAGAVRELFGKEFDALAIGKELQSDTILEGSYRNEGESVRVNVRLLSVLTGEPLWAETLIVKGSNQIELENLISLRVARKIQLRVAHLRDEKMAAKQNIGPETLKNYITARQMFRAYEYNRRKEMIGLFEKIIAAEPNWAPGFSGYAEALAMTHGGRINWQEAETAARRALELDGANSEAYVVLGLTYEQRWDWEKAGQAFQTALRLNPENAFAYNEYGVMLDFSRRFAEAESMLKKAVELEPFSPLFYNSLCEHYYFDERFEEALTQCRQAEMIDDDFWLTRKKLFWIYVQMRKYDEIEKLDFGHLSEIEKAKDPLAKALVERNLPLFWKRVIERRANNPNKQDSPTALAHYYVLLGENEKALDYLEKAVENFNLELPRVNSNPVFNPVRKEPRFIELVKKINLQP